MIRGDRYRESLRRMGANVHKWGKAIPDVTTHPATRLHVDGLGWDRPADPKNPLDQAKNRRVEIKVYTAEKQ